MLTLQPYRQSDQPHRRVVWIRAGEILAEHGGMTADYVIDRLSDVLDDAIAVEDWRRIAAAVDAISGTTAQ